MALVDDGVSAGLPSAEELRTLVGQFLSFGIPKLVGGPQHRAYVDFLDAELTSAGLDVVRESQPCEHWAVAGFTLSLVGDQQERLLPVLACARGSLPTPAGGVVGPLVDLGSLASLGTSADLDLAGTVILVDVEGTASYPELSDAFGRIIGTHAAAPPSQSWSDLILSSHKVSGPFPLDGRPALTSLFKNLSHLDVSHLAERGVLAVIAVMAEGTTAGMQGVAPPLTGLPALSVDRDTAGLLRDAVRARQQVRVTIDATKVPSSTDQLTALLPGASEDIIMLHTHTDGVSAFQENGGLGVLALARQLAAVPQAERPVTFAFVFATGHMDHDVQSTDFFLSRHPELVPRIKAAIAVEHLGAMEYAYDSDGEYLPTGRPEPSLLFVSPDARSLVEETARAVVDLDLDQSYVLRPMADGKVILGEGVYPHLLGIPTLQHMSGPDYLLSDAHDGNVGRLSVERMSKQIEVLAAIVHRHASTVGAG